MYLLTDGVNEAMRGVTFWWASSIGLWKFEKETKEKGKEIKEKGSNNSTTRVGTIDKK